MRTTHALRVAVLACVLMLGARVAAAAATVTVAPSPVAIAATHVGGTTMTTATLTATAAGVVVDHVTEVGAGCTSFATTFAVVLPYTFTNVGDTLAMGVAFTPLTRGALTCQLSLRNTANTEVGTVNATGTGTSAVMVTSSATLAFPATRVTGGLATLTFTVNNTTTDVGEDLTVTLALAGANPGDFAATPLAFVVAPGDAQMVSVEFDPSTAGARAATVTVTGDDPANTTDTVALTGSGTTAVIKVGPDPVAFGNIVVGDTSTLAATVSNIGIAGTLTVTGAAITGGSWFELGAAPQPDCAGGGTCAYAPTRSVVVGTPLSVDVRCAPPVGATGTDTATLTFTSDSDAGGVASTTLRCTAVQPVIDLAFTTHDYGDVRVNTNAPVTLTIGNTGTSVLTYSLVKSGANPAEFTVSGCVSNCAVAAGGSVNRVITFRPTVEGARAATLTVNSDDQATPSVAITLTGTGVRPAIAKVVPAGATLAFGSINVGATSGELAVTVTNTGTENLDITSVSSTGAAFAITAGPVAGPFAPIAPGANATWMLTCAPTARGNLSGTFTVASDAVNDPSFDLPITCKGIGGQLTVDRSSIDFGPVLLDASATEALRITNIGELPVVISDAALADATLGYSVDAFVMTLGAAGSGSDQVDVTLRFTPLDNGDGGPTTLTIDSDWNDPTVAIDGDASVVGLDVSTSSIDFGDVRWDATANRSFTITNTGEVAANLGTIGLTSADFQLISITVGATVQPAGTFVLPAGAIATVVVRANPNDLVLGTLTGALEIDSELAVGGNAGVALVVTSTAPELTITPGMTMAFGAVDLDVPTAAVQTLRLTNTGDGVLDLDSIALTNAGIDDVFGLAAPLGVTVQLAPGASIDRQVTYQPVVERVVGAGDEGVITVTIDGLHDDGGGAAPSTVVVALTGHGTDRHLALPADVIQFAPTYRHPADPPILPVTVTNTGEADLTLSAVMLTGDAAFTLLDDASVVVASGDSVTFRVQFAPTVVADDLMGQLLISHDDDALPGGGQAIVELRGDGIAREVAASPGTIDLGVTAVGIPVRLRDRVAAGLTLTSTGSVAFTVQPLQLVNDPAGVFRLLDGEAVRALPAGASLSYDLEFAPSTAGQYSATLRVFLDDDPDAFAEVQVTGWAVDTTARGGCDSSSGGLGGLAGALVVLGLLAMRSRTRTATGLVVLGLALLMPTTFVHADDGRQLDATTFQPRVSVDATLFEVQPATIGTPGAWTLGLTLGYAMSPLQIDVDCGTACPPAITDGMSDTPVSAQAMLQLGGAVAVTRWLELGAAVPVWLQQGDAPMFSAQPADGMTLGDVALHAKAQVWQRAALATALAARITAPTATSEDFVGGAGPTGELQAITSWHPPADRMVVAANLGVLARPTTTLGQTSQGSQVTYGVGVGYRAANAMWLAGEIFGGVGINEGGAANAPLQGVVGLRYRVTPELGVALGGGVGILGGVGVPTARAFMILSYNLGGRSHEPVARGGVPSGQLRDDDRDGVANRDDQCPQQAEDVDLFEDQDGCPDLDNDHDGVPDDRDLCSMDSEDIDGFIDDDGCADVDNDGDGVLDATDRCPLDAEDPDQHDDLDGCPDLDDDSDGLADLNDACPQAAETINGTKDEDGCPDAGESLVLRSADRIELLEPLRFVKTGSSLAAASYNVLGQVAATLRANPTLNLTVEVHVTERGAGDQALSIARAQAIVTWLTQWGLAPERLTAVGRGTSAPLVPKTDRLASQLNERVEFILSTR